MNLTIKRLTCFVGLAAASFLPGLATAGTLNVFVSNLDVQFDDNSGGDLFEVANPVDGDGDPAVSQAISSAEFELDGTTEALLTSPPDDIFADFLFSDLGDELPLGALIENQGTGGTFELFSPGGFSLVLDVDPISFLGVDIPAAGLGVFNFFATASVVSQDLPGGLGFVDDVLITFTSADAVFLGGPTTTTGLLASGSLTIAGLAIPEPSSVTLLGLLATSGLAAVRRRV